MTAPTPNTKDNPLPTHPVTCGDYEMVCRDFRWGDYAHLTPEDKEDFICYEVIESVSHNGGTVDIDDLPASVALELMRAAARSLAGNGRSGSRQRRRTHG